MPLEQWLITHLKKVLMGKKINILTVFFYFFIFHKNSVKTFLK